MASNQPSETRIPVFSHQASVGTPVADTDHTEAEHDASETGTPAPLAQSGVAVAGSSAVPMLWRENVYVHWERVKWIKGYIAPRARTLEFGCGTGCMITLPLLSQGVDIHGIDRSKESIAYGRDIFSRYPFDATRLLDGDLAEVHQQFDVIIASEVLEHVCDDELPRVLALLRERLKDDGKLLVTVPNGFGFFELDSLLYFKMGLGRLAERVRMTRVLERLKARIQGREYQDCPYQSTLDASPHLQHFTYSSIQALLEKNGFEILECKGSTLASGPFCHLLFSGYERIMDLNSRMGARLPAVAAGFRVAATLK
jgi:2-polyprenyl-3-methyl-5-hydroxy-6-metoxy-1,4-benzoquinol methylase